MENETKVKCELENDIVNCSNQNFAVLHSVMVKVLTEFAEKKEIKTKTEFPLLDDIVKNFKNGEKITKKSIQEMKKKKDKEITFISDLLGIIAIGIQSDENDILFGKKIKQISQLYKTQVGKDVILFANKIISKGFATKQKTKEGGVFALEKKLNEWEPLSLFLRLAADGNEPEAITEYQRGWKKNDLIHNEILFEMYSTFIEALNMIFSEENDNYLDFYIYKLGFYLSEYNGNESEKKNKKEGLKLEISEKELRKDVAKLLEYDQVRKNNPKINIKDFELPTLFEDVIAFLKLGIKKEIIAEYLKDLQRIIIRKINTIYSLTKTGLMHIYSGCNPIILRCLLFDNYYQGEDHESDSFLTNINVKKENIECYRGFLHIANLSILKIIDKFSFYAKKSRKERMETLRGFSFSSQDPFEIIHNFFEMLSGSDQPEDVLTKFERDQLPEIESIIATYFDICQEYIISDDQLGFLSKITKKHPKSNSDEKKSVNHKSEIVDEFNKVIKMDDIELHNYICNNKSMLRLYLTKQDEIIASYESEDFSVISFQSNKKLLKQVHFFKKEFFIALSDDKHNWLLNKIMTLMSPIEGCLFLEKINTSPKYTEKEILKAQKIILDANSEISKRMFIADSSCNTTFSQKKELRYYFKKNEYFFSLNDTEIY